MFRTALATVLALLVAAAPGLAQTTVSPGSAPATSSASSSSSGPPAVAKGTSAIGIFMAYAKHLGLAYAVLPGTPDTTIRLDVDALSAKDGIVLVQQLSGLATHKAKGILYIGTPVALAQMFGVGDRSQRTFTIVSMTATAAANALQPYVPPGTYLFPNDVQHTLTVSGTPSALDHADGFLRTLQNSAELTTKTIYLESGVSANNMAGELGALDPPQAPNAIVYDPGQNAFIVRGTARYIAQVENDLTAIDHTPAQIFYSLSIVEVDPDSYEKNIGPLIGGATGSAGNTGGGGTGTGLSSGSTGSFVLGFPIRTSQVSVRLNLLESQGKANILERPSVLASNGQAASTAYTTNLPITITDQFTGVASVVTVPTGVTLNLTPHIGRNAISTDLNVTYNTESGVGSGGYPIISQRSDQSTIVTQPDDSIVISGLYGETQTESLNGIYPFNHMWLLGGLFRNRDTQRNKTEVIMVLTPHLQGGNCHNQTVQFPDVNPSYFCGGILPSQPYPASVPAPAAQPHG